MRIKLLILGLALGSYFLGGCNDELSLVGPSIQPEQDKPAVFVDTFRFEASTVKMNAVYAKTDTSLLGEFYDPLYGTLKSDYMCQFYCPDNFSFEHTPINGTIDSVDYYIFYNSWIGDSLTPMRAQVYMVNKQLDKYYYTDINPADYCDMQTIMGAQAYTARNRTQFNDSIWSLKDDEDDGFIPYVKIRLSKEFGQKFYDETVNNPSSFANQSAFNQFLPGFYVTNTFGTGNVLNVVKSVLNIHYSYNKIGSAGQDSLVNEVELFSATKEVIQLNRFLNSDIDNLVQPNDDYTYLKTPAGVCTRIVIPISTIAPVVQNRILNNLAVSFQAMPQDSWQFALAPPQYLLMVPEDSVKTFFEQSQLPNNVSTYLSEAFGKTSPYYTFGNISNLLKHQMENDPDNDIALWLIPVNNKQEYNSYYRDYFTTGVSNFFTPSGVRLRKDEDMRRLIVTSSQFK